jgi:hypothetical protein
LAPLFFSSRSTVRPDHPALGVERGRVDDLRRGQLALDLEDAAFDEALLVLGRLVLGVLGQIALGTRFRDRLDHRMALDVLQSSQLFLQFFGTASGERDGGHISARRAVPRELTPPRGAANKVSVAVSSRDLGKKKAASDDSGGGGAMASLVQFGVQFLQ